MANEDSRSEESSFLEVSRHRDSTLVRGFEERDSAQRLVRLEVEMHNGLPNERKRVAVPRCTVVHFVNFCCCVARLPSNVEESSIVHVVEVSICELAGAVLEGEGNLFQHVGVG